MTGSLAAGPRSPVTHHEPAEPGHGSSRHWHRTIGGRDYSFTAVLMPSGQRRYFAVQLEAGADGRFACYWHPVLSWIIPPATATRKDPS